MTDDKERRDRRSEREPDVVVEQRKVLEGDRPWATYLLGLVCVVLVFAIGGMFRILDNQSDDADQKARDDHATCLRGNESREAILDLTDKLAAGNSARRDAWVFYRDNIATPGQSVTGAPVEEFARRQIDANSLEINGLRDFQVAFVASQSSVALMPNARLPNGEPDVHARAIVDCDEQAPLP